MDRAGHPGIGFRLRAESAITKNWRCNECPVPQARAEKLKVKIPWFIACFLLASVARSYVPAISVWSLQITHVAKGGLTLVLCLIGASLSPKTLHTVGWKAAVQGMLLWAFISAASLLLIVYAHVGQ